jgi:uncharacterized protein (TIGR02646 family)
MRKINKDFNDVPESLKPATIDFFPNGKYPSKCKTTHTKRTEVIANGEYPSKSKSYDPYYKVDDVRQRLIDIYHHKCAFCEQRVNQFHVEHYRPKKKKDKGDGQHHDGYYWLAFSWDNLLVACPPCNVIKKTHFDIGGVRATFPNTEAKLRNINSLSSEYDSQENPKFVNPEKEDPEGKLSFGKDGSISSSDDRYIYTIEKCDLNRKFLCDYRREILDDFEQKVRSVFVEFLGDKIKLMEHLGRLTKEFIADSNNVKKEYIAFRKYAITNNWLNDIVKACNA